MGVGVACVVIDFYTYWPRGVCNVIKLIQYHMDSSTYKDRMLNAMIKFACIHY